MFAPHAPSSSCVIKPRAALSSASTVEDKMDIKMQMRRSEGGAMIQRGMDGFGLRCGVWCLFRLCETVETDVTARLRVIGPGMLSRHNEIVNAYKNTKVVAVERPALSCREGAEYTNIDNWYLPTPSVFSPSILSSRVFSLILKRNQFNSLNVCVFIPRVQPAALHSVAGRDQILSTPRCPTSWGSGCPA